VGEVFASPTMFLFKENFIHKDIYKYINCNFEKTKLISFFYGSLENNFVNNINTYKNVDDEYLLYKKLYSLTNQNFSEQERNSLYFFSKLRSIISSHKMNGLSLFSHLFLNLFNYKSQFEIAEQIWNMEMMRSIEVTNYNIYYLFCELSQSGGDDCIEEVSNSRLCSFHDTGCSISCIEKDFIKFYMHIISSKINENPYLHKCVIESQKTFRCNKNLNIDILRKNFSILDDHIILIMLYHLEQDAIMSSVNGTIAMHKDFIKNHRIFKSKTAIFNKHVNNLIDSISYGKHELKKCDDRDVLKIYRSICNGKM
jgi:hypothetical protein